MVNVASHTAGDLAERVGAVRLLVRGGALGIMGSVLSAALGFLLVVVVTRSLGAAASGVAFAVFALFTMASNSCKLGADTGLVRELSRLRALGRKGDLGSVLWVAAVPVVVATWLLACAAWVTAPWIATITVPSFPADDVVPLIRVAALTLPFATAAMVALAATRGLGSVAPIIVVDSIAKPSVRLLLVVLAVNAGWGVFGVTAAWLVPAGAAAVVALMLLWRLLRLVRNSAIAPPGTSPTSREAMSTEFWRFATPRGFAAVIEIVGASAGVLMVSALAGSHEAGAFAAVSRFVLVGLLVKQALRFVVAPQFSALLARRRTREAEDLHRVSTVWIAALSCPLYVLSAVFAPLVLQLFGEDFDEGATALSVLSVAMLVNVLSGNVQTVLLMSGASAVNLGIVAVSLTANVVASLLVIPQFGVTGAAIVWGACIAFENLATVGAARLRLGIRTISGPLARVCGAALLAFGVVTGACAAWLGMSLGPAVVAAMLALGVYLALLWWQRQHIHLGELAGALRARSLPTAAASSGRGQR